jgi:hypothetical protein
LILDDNFLTEDIKLHLFHYRHFLPIVKPNSETDNEGSDKKS